MSELNRRNFLHNAGLASAAGVGASLLMPQQVTGQATGRAEAMLSDDELDYLRRFDTPTIANALERDALSHVHGRSCLDGVMTPKIRCIFPEMGIMNGYAATATIQASESHVLSVRLGALPKRANLIG